MPAIAEQARAAVRERVHQAGLALRDPITHEAQYGQFSNKQIDADSKAFFREKRWHVEDIHDRGSAIFGMVAQRFEDQKKEHFARICDDLGDSDYTIRNSALTFLQSNEGQEIRDAIISQTRHNMQRILYGEFNPLSHDLVIGTTRNTYSHDEVRTLMPDVLANIYAASAATLGFLPHDEQLYAAIGIVDGPGKHGTVVEMKTGEGKTFVAAASAIVNALHNSGVHVATPNDYLAHEGAQVAAQLAHAMGMTVGVLQSTPPEEQRVVNGIMVQKQLVSSPDDAMLQKTDLRHTAYEADITYGYKQEFEFDALYDNTAMFDIQLRQVRKTPEGKIDRTWNAHDAYAIIDEVDSVWLDQATTPSSIEQPGLIKAYVINGVVYTEIELRELAAKVVRQLRPAREIETEEKHSSKEHEEDRYTDGDFYFHGNRAMIIMREDAHLGIQKVEDILATTGIDIPGKKTKKPPILRKGERYIEGIGEIADTPEAAATMAHPPLTNVFDKFLHAALQAQFTEQENETYRVEIDEATKTKQIVLLNPHTRRDEALSRYQLGLSSALEAKHSLLEQEAKSGYTVVIKPESTVLTSSTTSEYWNRYARSSGLTGTANDQMPEYAHEQLLKSPAQEFSEYYKTQVIRVPSHETPRRIDHMEEYGYPFKEEKLTAMAEFIGTFYGFDNPNDPVAAFQKARKDQEGRPILVTFYDREQIDTFVQTLRSQQWFQAFTAQHPNRPIAIRTLSAEDTAEEAANIAQAGNAYTITIATIAGRGTDIRLTDEAREKGGLFVIGGDHGENRRIDMQIRGRAGRQGDPGDSRFFSSIEDTLLMRILGPQGVQNYRENHYYEDTDAEGTVTESGYMLISHTAMQELIADAQARLSNEHIQSREGLHRDYETIAAQMSAFNNDRKEVVLAPTTQEAVNTLVQRLLESQIISILNHSEDQSRQEGMLAPSAESVRAIPLSYMTEDEATTFVDTITSFAPLSEEQEQQLFQQALAHRQRDLVTPVTKFLMEQFQHLAETLPTHVQTQLDATEGLPDGVQTSMILNMPADAKLLMLTAFDAHMGDYFTQLLDVRDDIMEVRINGEKLPADAFRIEAYKMYRGFKPYLQRQMLKNLFSADTYIRHANGRLHTLITAVENGFDIKTLQSTSQSQK